MGRQLFNVPHQHHPKLFGGVRVGPILDTFVLKKQRDTEKMANEESEGVKDGAAGRGGALDNLKKPLILSSFNISLAVILSSTVVSCDPPPTSTHTLTHQKQSQPLD